MSRYRHHQGSKVSYNPGHHPGLRHPMRLVTQPRASWRLPWAWRPHVSNDLLSVRALRPSPDSPYVFRREPEGPEEATPSMRRLAEQARKLLGSPPPALRSSAELASTEPL